VANTTGIIGVFSSNNSALVTGAGSLWTNSGDLYVGNEGSGNSLVISNGGRVANTIGYIGDQPNSSNNSVLVTGSNSLWTNSGDLFVGLQGSGNSLVISNGGTVASGEGYIGAVSSNNSALVTGAGSLWTNSGNLYVGNSLVISNGGTVASGVGYIGLLSSNNSVLVTGSNSLWTNSGTVTIGAGGAEGNTLTVADGGQVVASEIVVNAGRLQADTAGAFGSTPLVTLGGGSGAAATFGFSANVSIGSLNWQSNSFLAPSSGGVLNISGLLTNGPGYGTFRLTVWYAPELRNYVAIEHELHWDGKLQDFTRDELTSLQFAGNRI
jgi:T5SS/PEP-CTERM-associated repeat protein